MITGTNAVLYKLINREVPTYYLGDNMSVLLKKEELTSIQCQNKKCNYFWKTRSKMLYVSCPRCLYKVRVPK